MELDQPWDSKDQWATKDQLNTQLPNLHRFSSLQLASPEPLAYVQVPTTTSVVPILSPLSIFASATSTPPPSTPFLPHASDHPWPAFHPNPSDDISPNGPLRYGCSHCPKRFARPSSLRTHCYSHSGEQPYNCEFENCGRKFSVQSNLRRHLKIHRAAESSATPSGSTPREGSEAEEV